MNKVILINGFAGVGKTTISKKYIEEHPLTLNIEGDQIIGMIGRWRDSEEVARELVFEHTKVLLETHLKAGHDVILPILLTNHTHVDEFQKIAESHDATLYEVLLNTNKEEAIERLFERGVWGEEGSEILTEKHRGEIEELYNTMVVETEKRPNTIKIEVQKGNVEETYSKFMGAVSN